jgi:hypothetical protein
MKTKRRRTEITIETHQSLVVRSSRRLVGTQCAECAGHSWLVSPEEAAAFAGVKLRTIFHWVEANRIHFAETPAGLVLVCLNSLPRRDGAEARP